MTKLSLDRTKLSKGYNRFKNKYLPLYIMLIPFLLFYVFFMYKPLGGLSIAFQDYSVFKGISGSEWVGLKHFRDFFDTPYVGRLFKNTIFLNLYCLIFNFPAPIIFALLLNEVKNACLKKSIQTLTYVPHFISMVVCAGIFMDLLSPSHGIITRLVEMITGKRFYFLTIPKFFRTIYATLLIWKELGYRTIVYLAAISGIDSQLYEAAAIDGANKLRRTWHITLPGIAPTIVTLLIMNMGSLLASGTDTILLLYQPATYEVSDVIGTYVYREGLTGANYSYAAAVGLFNSITSLILVALANFTSKKVMKVGLW